jgi:ethanolamine ammonia-lyase small subunit
MDTTMHSAQRPELLSNMLEVTPARIAVGRSGTRPLTSTWLTFRRDHAMARDAVHSELSEEFLREFAIAKDRPVIVSTATDRHDYILYPPKGKRTSNETVEMLEAKLPHGNDVQIVVSDGLSARAVEANIPDLLPMLEEGLALEKISCGTPVFARFARVAIADQIGHALGAKVAINLIGERPGLSSAASLSAYITFNPGPHTISSDRTVISNIHERGTPAVEAGAYIVKVVRQILEKKASGVLLQQLS